MIVFYSYFTAHKMYNGVIILYVMANIVLNKTYIIHIEFMVVWPNWLWRKAHNLKVGGSSPLIT